MIGWRSNPAKIKQYLLLFGDTGVFIVSLFSSIVIQAVLQGKPFVQVVQTTGMIWQFPVLVIYLIALFVFSLYDFDVSFGLVRGVTRVILATLVTFTLFGILLQLSGHFSVGKILLFSQGIILIVGISLWRYIFFDSLLLVRKQQRIALVGLDNSIEKFLEGLEWFPVKEFALVGVLTDKVKTSDALAEGLDHLICTDSANLGNLLQEKEIDTLVFSIHADVSDDLLRQALALQQQGVVQVYDLPSFYSHLLGKIPVFSVNAVWVLQSIKNINTKWNFSRNLKRFFDVFLAGIIILLAWPVFLIIALAIKLDSKGPVLFIQERYGLNKVPFGVYKFRTMVENAEAISGPVWAEENDPRITRVGHILRKTRLDELPQFLNVIRGEMSIIGFRPIRHHFAEILEEQIPFYSLRFSIKPGITGWPQVQYGYSGSVEGQVEKFEYEMFYLVNHSFFLDIFIVLKTVQTVIFGRGQ